MSQQQGGSKLVSLSQGTGAITSPDLGSSMVSEDDKEPLVNVCRRRPNNFGRNTSKSSNRIAAVPRKQVRWRTELDDESSEDEDERICGVSDSEAWYSGEYQESKRCAIARDWVTVPAPKSDEDLALEHGDGREFLQPPTLDSKNDWDILPRLPEKSAKEVKKEEADCMRYHWAIWKRQFVNTAWVGMAFELTSRIVGEAFRGPFEDRLGKHVLDYGLRCS